MEPSIARDTTSSTNTSHISHEAGQRMCFDACIQTASAKIQVSEPRLLMHSAEWALSTQAVGVWLLSGMLR